MEQVTKRSKKKPPMPRWVWLVLLLVAAGAGLVIWRMPKPLPELPSAVTYGEIRRHDPGEVAVLQVKLRGEDTWTMHQDTAGHITLEGENGALNPLRVTEAIHSAAVVSYERILADTPDEYAVYLAEMGLADPYVTAVITYRDGEKFTLSIGDEVLGEQNRWFYLLVDGDQRLFALDRGTVEGLAINRANLLQVDQPVLHADRMDRITLSGEDGTRFVWALEGSITDGNADDRWIMVEPYRYPADGSVIRNLRKTLEHLYIGPKEAAATPGNLPAYGFDPPRITLAIHQQAGEMGTTGAAGTFGMASYPEETFALEIGAAKSEVLQYVRYQGHIHVMSRHITDGLQQLKPADTLSPYLLHMDATALSAMTVEQDGQITQYQIQRGERVAANNELERDGRGRVIMDYTVTKNGTPMAWDAFAAWYDQLAKVEVSGVLKPADLETASMPHICIITEDTLGHRDEITLSPMDPFHHRVTINGTSIFYLVKDGLTEWLTSPG